MPEIDDRSVRVIFNGNNDELEMKFMPRPNELMRFFRILVARDKYEMLAGSFPISRERELAAAKMCYDSINTHLANKGTSFEYDLELLELHRTNQKRLNRHAELALLYRIDQKIIALRNQNVCAGLMERVLPCFTESGLHKPFYFKRLRMLRGGAMKRHPVLKSL